MALGRPSKYKPEYCQMLVDHMASGLSFESFAAVIDVNRDTLWEWLKVHEDFSDSQKVASDKCRLFWEKLGINEIMNVSEYQGGSKSLNSTVWIFNMKNRFGWRDKQEIEQTTTINGTLNLETLANDLDEVLKSKKK